MGDLWLESAKMFMTVAQRVWQRGLVAGSGGNISLRLPGTDHVMIKPRGIANIDCRPETLLRVDLEGQVLSDEGCPSKDLGFHLGIYRVRPEVQGIVHAHVPWATALTLVGYHEMPLFTPHAQAKLKRVPVVPYAPSESPELNEAVTEAFRPQRIMAVLLERHGVVTVGKTLSAAADIAELVEETAQIAMLMHMAGRPTTDDQRRMANDQ